MSQNTRKRRARNRSFTELSERQARKMVPLTQQAIPQRARSHETGQFESWKTHGPGVPLKKRLFVPEGWVSDAR